MRNRITSLFVVLAAAVVALVLTPDVFGDTKIIRLKTPKAIDKLPELAESQQYVERARLNKNSNWLRASDTLSGGQRVFLAVVESEGNTSLDWIIAEGAIEKVRREQRPQKCNTCHAHTTMMPIFTLPPIFCRGGGGGGDAGGGGGDAGGGGGGGDAGSGGGQSASGGGDSGASGSSGASGNPGSTDSGGVGGGSGRSGGSAAQVARLTWIDEVSEIPTDLLKPENTWRRGRVPAGTSSPAILPFAFEKAKPHCFAVLTKETSPDNPSTLVWGLSIRAPAGKPQPTKGTDATGGGISNDKK